jgi:8-amino-7-oxononanoate synthase
MGNETPAGGPSDDRLPGAVAPRCASLQIFEKARTFTRAREVQEAGLYPYFLPISENLGPEVVINGHRVIMLGSNNYLGLVQHEKVKEAFIQAVRKFGSGCTGSRFLNGTLRLHIELEERLARFMRREAALTFSTGFQANQGVISTVVGKDDVIYCDRENHASIFEGCRLSYGQVRKFKHNDMHDLERLLGLNDRGHGKLIVVDGVFSMSGEIVDLPRITDLARANGAAVMVDDAHSLGVLGEHGRGTAEHYGLEDRVDLVLGTFSKSFAGLGGFVVGDADIINYIKHHARALIFSASITPGSCAGVIAALDIIESEPERRAILWDHFRFLKAGFDALGFDTLNSRTPVIPVLVPGDELHTFLFWKELLEAGVYTNAVIPPAVPPGMGLIRTSLMATHTRDHLTRVLEVFETVGRRLGVI